ncbi:hypothetical protein Pint_20428 [Pistacia integerrima]|uniref:Uncharacterized protein n=1 Tax=Pistacia integerrima TaxID=434235 RepID=A0ACC0XB08_9ROSI|nr:hypothetical protein Pint_20428 [Pistacia integerrima]
MLNWIKCVTPFFFSMAINGKHHDLFSCKRSLHQGDPLSPYLFTIVMQVLSLIINRKIRDRERFRFQM